MIFVFIINQISQLDGKTNIYSHLKFWDLYFKCFLEDGAEIASEAVEFFEEGSFSLGSSSTDSTPILERGNSQAGVSQIEIQKNLLHDTILNN